MSPDTTLPEPHGLDDYLEAYEAARAAGITADLADFLPPPDDALHGQVLRELVRVDMEYAWRRGEPCTIAEYVRRFPHLRDDAQGLEEIVFEERRLRAQTDAQPAGDPAQGPAGAADFLSRFLDQEVPRFREGWRSERASAQAREPAGRGLAEAVRSYRSFQREGGRVAGAAAAMPAVGDAFLDFRLVAELGRGAFARVYLAEQPELAGRQVVLKVAGDVHGETQRLAQLQHTHIVPVYSLHRSGPFQAVCMPYFGSTTLADLLHDLEGRPSLPASGRAVVSTLRGRRDATRRGLERSRTSAEVSQPDLSPRPPPHDAEADPGLAKEAASALETMEGLTYVETILWMALRLADGLAHAHERGILHRDLKPANVLLTDDGQPMLLDFNLAEDTKQPKNVTLAAVGGTLPYMAPEHLTAFQGLENKVDARSDLYSFGVILYELLAGRHPFRLRKGSMEQVLAHYLEERRAAPPSVRRHNPAVSPAVASILQHCLEPDPAQRYQSARQLHEDLERHLHNLPLKHASEPSWRERAVKFHRRHPLLTSSLSLGTAAGVALLLLALAFVGRGQRLARLDALGAHQQFQGELRTARFLLNVQTGDPEELRAGLAEGRRALDRYGAADSSAWREQAAVRFLPDADRRQLDQDVGELLLLLARGTELAARGDTTPIQLALHLNERAEACFGAEAPPRALWLQRADLYSRLGRDDEARHARTKAAAVPPRSARDHYLIAAEHTAHGRFREALPLLQEAARLDPQSHWAWFLLGYCHDGLGHDAKAEACYGTCVALAPQSHWAYFNRGVVFLRQQDHRQACADFDRVVKLRPDLADAYVNRALARQGLKRLADAAADLTRALELGTAHARVHFMRARVRELAGDPVGAAQDRAEGLQREPTDEKSWVARGVARVGTDDAGALADFDQALRLNPRSRAAWQNKAHVLAERLGRTWEAAEALDQAATFYPDAPALFAARAVLRARLGEVRAAHADAEEALRLDSGPATLYQLAGVFALTSRQQPDDRRQAFALLSGALRKGYGFELLDEDHDLDPLRQDAEFGRLVEAARTLAPRR